MAKGLYEKYGRYSHYYCCIYYRLQGSEKRPSKAYFRRKSSKILESTVSFTPQSKKKLESRPSSELWEGLDCDQQPLLHAFGDIDCKILYCPRYSVGFVPKNLCTYRLK